MIISEYNIDVLYFPELIKPFMEASLNKDLVWVL